jgi:hypothetical protein
MMKLSAPKMATIGCIIILSSQVFAQKISVGTLVAWDPYWISINQSLESAWAKDTLSSSEYLADLYVDLVYLQINVGYLGSIPYSTINSSNGSGYSNSYKIKNTYTGQWLHGSAYVKVPVKFKNCTIAPIVGAEYDYNIAYYDNDGNNIIDQLSDNEKSDLNLFWLKIGFYGEIPFNNKFYCRTNVYYGWKIPNTNEINYVTNISETNADTVSIAYTKLDLGFSFGVNL